MWARLELVHIVVPRTIALDVAALGSLQSGKLLIIDANTSVIAGPTATSVTSTSPMSVTLTGYRVAFVTLR